ncbi:hypothetical protein J6590_049049 [Homalodisca vitripennis]|nr:hypothetical protein J6590_049049 [Homalodisca vitripennis]
MWLSPTLPPYATAPLPPDQSLSTVQKSRSRRTDDTGNVGDTSEVAYEFPVIARRQRAALSLQAHENQCGGVVMAIINKLVGRADTTGASVADQLLPLPLDSTTTTGTTALDHVRPSPPTSELSGVSRRNILLPSFKINIIISV